VKRRLDAGEKLTIVDLRAPMEWQDGKIPGSIQGVDQALKSLSPENPRSEVILYCSSPDEARSARMALRLQRQGVQHVRPLEGGFARWRALGFPVESPVPQTVRGT
jgi:rhodanese-related sulfurtransferase